MPHLIDHVATLRALAELDCDRVLALSSVGGLRAELVPGTLLCPHDFIALDAEPLTALEGAEAHRVPGFDPAVARRAARRAGRGRDRRPRRGRLLAGPRATAGDARRDPLRRRHADVIGMTVGSECAIAGELGLRYAALCVVDNLANGIGEAELTLDEIERNRTRNQAALRATLDAILPRLAG